MNDEEMGNSPEEEPENETLVTNRFQQTLKTPNMHSVPQNNTVPTSSSQLTTILMVNKLQQFLETAVEKARAQFQVQTHLTPGSPPDPQGQVQQTMRLRGVDDTNVHGSKEGQTPMSKMITLVGEWTGS